MEGHMHDFVVKLLSVSFLSETIMEGHMREHDPLYTSVLFVMFDEGGWVGGGVVWWVVGVEWSGVVLCGVVSSRGQSEGVRIVVSCDHESGLCI